MEFIKNWWHVLAGFAILIFGVAETRVQVQQLMERSTAEAKQWELIRLAGEKNREQELEIEWIEHRLDALERE